MSARKSLRPRPAWVVGLVLICLVAAGAVAMSRGTFAILGGAAGAASTAEETEQPPTAVFVGDSYTAAEGGEGVRWTSLVAQEQGWRELNVGRGGTGWTVAVPADRCRYGTCPTYPEVAHEVVDLAPEIVVVAGGRNDRGNDVAAAAAETFATLREGLPDARIYAVSPFWDSTAYPAHLIAQGRDVREEVRRVGGEYLEVGHPLGGRPDLITQDGIHPNAAGYRALAEAVNEALDR
ncbi:SGNH/GDSL hydrolase family protein [Georgenia daeguensis]|uniref:SGNH hydrolase-type esterase domain-containing protein n=1 Tax=Georgenia daeguensis TaxID=908355 RepID=A0ABP6UPR9_9MICO